MSGILFECNVDNYFIDDDLDSSVPKQFILDDLARTIVEHLPDSLQTTKRFFVIFDLGPECEPIAVTPWDWSQPLADFLPLRLQGPEA
eukprot:CAMPEP_0194757836 /NCGR_PEP_ID=MMETSP0323_2-20130528/11256_1 /TAXON_ID=2866 ORGANISM="Crypthecodinium cohnii, Strain Seligo" /NCGR_SAMPLE_ID=MMETSP0323_2 /ASSEMBLY_ACC=CAM_ASM_000346 /LENGTH=87 /DNA_ID=CAMNT_0039677941 /DNA_START=44 /DNA_END=307 /DNA_ORIENTATION=+